MIFDYKYYKTIEELEFALKFNGLEDQLTLVIQAYSIGYEDGKRVGFDEGYREASHDG